MAEVQKQDVVIVTPIYAPKLEELDRRFALHRLWEAKDRAAFYAPLAAKVRAIVSSGPRPNKPDSMLAPFSTRLF